ncbi:hypothetical protein EDB81DRAFT_769345 [Dactylonectria macrodidyma]|uniref:Uncharacterized protein n=1 Tax=Dactylonectria macrodidyma TaxID=307937 RepID=A0A9P9CXJ3_9HYPO|nr:hypothetical protein EDB81DRAFT_769345 [Dactylonectria macrodidyma]
MHSVMILLLAWIRVAVATSLKETQHSVPTPEEAFQESPKSIFIKDKREATSTTSSTIPATTSTVARPEFTGLAEMFAALSAADEALSPPVTSVVDNEKRELPSTITAYLDDISAVVSLVQATSSPSIRRTSSIG